jgi:hypothetical protein
MRTATDSFADYAEPDRFGAGQTDGEKPSGSFIWQWVWANRKAFLFHERISSRSSREERGRGSRFQPGGWVR